MGAPKTRWLRPAYLRAELSALKDNLMTTSSMSKRCANVLVGFVGADAEEDLGGPVIR